MTVEQKIIPQNFILSQKRSDNLIKKCAINKIKFKINLDSRDIVVLLTLSDNPDTIFVVEDKTKAHSFICSLNSITAALFANAYLSENEISHNDVVKNKFKFDETKNFRVQNCLCLDSPLKKINKLFEL